MQDIEQQIAELERKLLVKKAYMAALISFKGTKTFPDDVKAEVESSLLEFAQSQASSEVAAKVTAQLSNEEIVALKALAQSVLSRSVAKSKPAANVATPIIPPPEVPKTGTLLMLDSLSKSLKKKVQPGSEVRILETRENKFYVQDGAANRFWVPQTDIELKA